MDDKMLDEACEIICDLSDRLQNELFKRPLTELECFCLERARYWIEKNSTIKYKRKIRQLGNIRKIKD